MGTSIGAPDYRLVAARLQFRNMGDFLQVDAHSRGKTPDISAFRVPPRLLVLSLPKYPRPIQELPGRL
jgi:hypothetical protein